MKKTYNLRSKSRPEQIKKTACTTTNTPSQRPKLPVPVDPLTPATDTPRKQVMDPTLADLQNSLKEFSSRVCNKLDTIHEDISSMKKRITDIEAAVDDNSARMLDFEKDKLPKMEMKLQKEIDQLKEKMMLSEIYQRRSNLLFYGLERKQNEDVEIVLRKAFVSLGLNEDEAQSIAIVNAHRLPRRDKSASSAPEPIIAKFVYMGQRNRLLFAFEKRPAQRPGIDQRNPRISVRTDLPPTLKAERGALAARAYKFRKENNLSTKIVVAGCRVILYTKARNATEWQPYKE